MSLVLLFSIAVDDFFNGSGGKSRHNAYAVGGRANLLHVRVSTTLCSVPLNDVQLFHPSSLHSGVASRGTKCELHEEHLSASDNDEEDHNTWDVLFGSYDEL